MSGNTRSLPSTIWATLALGLSPIGSVPFVDIDGVSIVTDILHFKYTAAAVADTSNAPYSLLAWGGLKLGMINIPSPAVSITCNAPMGRFYIPIGQAVVTVFNSYLKANGFVFLQILTGDATLTRITPQSINAGVFFAVGNVAATNAVQVEFLVVNSETVGP